MLIERALEEFLISTVVEYNRLLALDPKPNSREWGLMEEQERIFDDVGKMLECNVVYGQDSPDKDGQAIIFW